ncbi:LysR family transcriptional regulator [Oceanobacillus damuensis]|uniref:LysR family transcriptional regulator n=1 Tax=Oceanobacillus damuensis TaxID=937928 RepID=UPI000832F864|nr:LysR family transcriptional regulator [Oceanobacillus damuensis]
MNIENLEAFVFVNHFGSINRAAKALFLSQPSVTSRIRTLERELDTKLFDRVGKQLIITDQAREFIPYAEGIIQTYKKGKKQLKEKEAVDQLIIGCTGLVSNYLIPQVIPLFNVKYPNVRIKLITGSSDVILKKVLNSEVDIGFVRKNSNGPHPLTESVKVLESPIRLYVHPDHRFAKAEQLDTEDLAIQPIVFFECGSLDWSMVHNLFHNLSELPNIQYEVDNMEAAKGLIINGTGIGFLPELCVRKEVADGRLKAIDIPVLSNVSLKTDIIYYKDQKPAIFDHLLQISQDEGRLTSTVSS